MLFVAGIALRDEGPELLTVVHVLRVSEFVDKDVVNKLKGQFHQSDVEADGAFGTTTPPATTGMREAHPLVLKAELVCEKREPFWEVAFCFYSKSGDDDVAHGSDDVVIAKGFVLREINEDPLAFTTDRQCPKSRLYKQGVALAYPHTVLIGCFWLGLRD